MKKLISSLLIAVSAALFSASALAGNVAEVINAFGGLIGTYSSTADALSAIHDGADGSTLRLLAECEASIGGDFGKSFTLDLNGFTLHVTKTSQYFIGINEGETVTIKNGKMDWASTCNYIVNLKGGTLNMEDVTITSSVTSPDIMQTGGTATIKDCVFGGDSRSVMGVYVDGGVGIVENCEVTVKSGSAWQSAALAVAGNATLTVKGGTYTSPAYSMYVLSSGGTINVEDGNFSGPVYLDGNSNSSYGRMNIKGGDFTSVTKFGGRNGTYNSYMVTGGTFASDPSKDILTIPTGYEVKNNGDGTYTVQKKGADNYVAQNDAGSKYETLADAFSGTAVNGTITLLKDCTISSQITCSKSISLDLNGHQIDVSGIEYLFKVTGSGDFYLSGSGIINAPKGVFLFQSTGTLTIDDIEMNTNVGARSDTAGFGNKFSSGKVVVTNLKGTTLYGSMFYFDGPCTGTFGAGNSIELIGILPGMSNNNPYLSSSFGLANSSAEVTVEGGYYKSACYGAYIMTSGGTFTMTGGTLEAGKTVLYYDGNSNGSMSISGGQFKVVDTVWLARAGHDEKGKVSITGGEFNVNPIDNCYKGEGITPANVTKTTTFVAEGYGATPVTRFETETWYKVGLPPVAVDDDGNEYTTLKAALEDVKAGGTIKVLAGCSLPSEAVKINRSLTLDLNGQTIAVPSYQGSILSFLAADTAATVVISNGNVAAGGSTADTCFIECNSSKGKVVLADLTATVACNKASPDLNLYPAFVRSSAKGGVVEVVRCNFTATSTHKTPLLRTSNDGDFVVKDTTLDNSLAMAASSFLGAAITIDNTSGACHVTLSGDCRFSRTNGTMGAVVFSNGGGTVLAEPGTYNFDPSAWVDTAKYKVTGPEKNIWTVKSKKPSDPLPAAEDVTTPEKVAEVMADAAETLKANVTTVEEYSDFLAWVEDCKLDHETVKENASSFFSFATAQSEIVDMDTLVTPETVKTVGMEPTADGVKLTVKITDLPVGEGAQQKYLEKVFGAKGSDSLTGFSKENVQYVAESMVRTADGSVTFAVKPAEKFDAPSRFFFVGTVSPDGDAQ